jgi:threonine aldolase
MNFASDNTAGIAPEILDALAAGNDGFALGYGNDDVTRAVERRIGEIFEREASVFLVPTGTAANALALAHVSPPWGAVFAHSEAHILTDECGAPEFFGGGLKLVGMPGVGCKVAPETLAAHAHGMSVHMDGARFANALVRLNASPAEITWKAGVDVLSFGATKGGALAAEAVVFFDPGAARNMAERRKRAGHLLSKHRFLALQFQAFLAGDCWLRLARHANAMAERLATGLAAAGCPPVWPVEANLVFILLSKAQDARLQAAGARYYVRRSESLAAGVAMEPGRSLVRLVTSFATRADEVDRFIALAAKA